MMITTNSIPSYVAPTFLALTLAVPIDSAAKELDPKAEVEKTSESILENSKKKAKASSKDVVELEDMIVKDRRFDTDIKLRPINSTVVSREEIERIKFTDPDEILNRIPGTSLSRNFRIPKGGKGYTISVIDGVSVRNPYSGSTQQIADTNTFDIERIEVIKGPASVLYGSNAFGGVVNVITRDPPKDSEYKVWIEGGSFDRIRGGLNAAGTAGPVGYSVDFNIWDIDGYRDGEKNDRKAVSGKLLFHPDSLSNLKFSGEYMDRFSKSAGTLSQSEFDDNPKQNVAQNTFSEKETVTGSVAFDREMWTDGHINANFGYRHEDSYSLQSFGGGAPSKNENNDMNVKVWYKHDFDFLKASLMGGGSYYYGDNDNQRFNRRSKEVTRSSYNEQAIYSGFAELQFSPIDKLRVTGGFRYEGTDFKSTDKINGGVTRAEFTDVTPVAGFTYDITNDHKFWFGYSEGFSSPSLSSLFTSQNNNPNLKPEEATNYEIGIRGAFLEDKLTYDVAFYYQDITNYIVNSITGVDRRGQEEFNFQNAGEVNLRGVETVIEYQPWEYLRLGVTHTYARNEYTNFIDRDRTLGKSVDLSGNRLAQSPDHHVNARVAVLPIKGLEIELEIDAYTGYFTNNQNNLDKGGEYTRPTHLNLRTSYEREGWGLWVHALNLTNELEERVGYTPASRGRGGRPGKPGGRQIRVAEGFSIYGGVSYKF